MKKLVFFLAFTSTILMYSQADYLSVNAGADLTGNCGDAQNLTATYIDLKDTSTYAVASLAYMPPTDFTSGAVPGGLEGDKWTDVIDLGFSFCYYGNTYTQFVIGENGQISFNTTYSAMANHFDFSDGGVPIALPQATDDDLAFNTVFGPGLDLDSAGAGATITYELIGAAPYRAMVVKFNAVAEFNCNTLKTTSMIVLNETTNNIDVYIKDKPICMAWNDGYALVGINNIDGTASLTPPGRNTSNWVVEDGNATRPSEAWRFTPDGASVTTFEWTDASGTSLGTNVAITVSPTMDTVYTTTVSYTDCLGNVITLSDDVNVTMNAQGPIVDLGGDTTFCNMNSMDLDATPTNAADFNTLTYLWNTGETTPQITVTTSGTYSVTVTADGTCTGYDEVVLEAGTTANITFPDAPFQLCHAISPAQNESITITAVTEGQDPTQFTYQWFDENASLISTTSSVSVSEPGTYTIIATGGSCPSTQTVDVTYYSNEYCTYQEGISPNGDQLNDNFDLTWVNQTGKTIKNLKIFNRYGSPVFEKSDYTNEFEGKSDKDYDLPSGTYFYVIQLSDDTVKEGWLYINR